MKSTRKQGFQCSLKAICLKPSPEKNQEDWGRSCRLEFASWQDGRKWLRIQGLYVVEGGVLEAEGYSGHGGGGDVGRKEDADAGLSS